LNNDGETSVLKSNNGYVIHAVGYFAAWFENEIKEPAVGRWKHETQKIPAPVTITGKQVKIVKGNTREQNSMDALIADDKPPQIKNSYLVDKTTIVAVFDEPLEFKRVIDSHYTIDGGLSIIEASVLPPLFDHVH
jgi:hypothetical protein